MAHGLFIDYIILVLFILKQKNNIIINAKIIINPTSGFIDLIRLEVFLIAFSYVFFSILYLLILIDKQPYFINNIIIEGNINWCITLRIRSYHYRLSVVLLSSRFIIDDRINEEDTRVIGVVTHLVKSFLEGLKSKFVPNLVPT